jgi:hypothetical protein
LLNLVRKPLGLNRPTVRSVVEPDEPPSIA